VLPFLGLLAFRSLTACPFHQLTVTATVVAAPPVTYALQLLLRAGSLISRDPARASSDLCSRLEHLQPNSTRRTACGEPRLLELQYAHFLASKNALLACRFPDHRLRFGLCTRLTVTAGLHRDFRLRPLPLGC